MDASTTTPGSAILKKRHGGNHFINVKYGYLVLFLSAVYLFYRYGSLYYYNKSWSRSGRSTTNLGIVSIPMAYLVSIGLGILIIIEFFNMNLGEFNIHWKRFGRIAYALIPLDIILTIRPSPSRYDNYLNSLSLHKWLSRIVLLFSIIHGVGFFLKWLGDGTLKKLFKIWNLIGVIPFVVCCVLFIINWRPLRSKNYDLFYLIHNLTVWSFLVLVTLHARPDVYFITFLSVVLTIWGLYAKLKGLKTIELQKVVEKEGSNLQLIRIPKSILPFQFIPGAHVRLGYIIKNPKFWLFPTHPYTIASNYEDRDPQVSLVIKKSKFRVQLSTSYSIQPNLPSSLSLNFFQTAENISIVCGGSGISFGLPIFNHFKNKVLREGADIKLNCIWVTPNQADLYLVDELKIEGIDIYVTNGTTDVLPPPPSTNDLSTVYDPFQDVELESLSLEGARAYTPQTRREGILGDESDEYDDERVFKNNIVTGTRPDLGRLLGRNSESTIDYANKWVISCGPVSLNDDCERLANGLKCRFFSEEYAM